MTLDDGFKRVPIMNGMSSIIDSIYLPRGGSEESRN